MVVNKIKPIEEIVTQLPAFSKRISAKKTPEEDFKLTFLEEAYQKNMVVKTQFGIPIRIQEAYISPCGTIWKDRREYNCDF
jgi:hypothetical protein